MKIHLRRTAQIAIALTVVALLVFRVLPRILPWSGQNAWDSLTWSPRILDAGGRMLQVVPVNGAGLRRIHVPYREIPPELLRIVRESEDKRFFFHPGVDFFALMRAAYQYAGDGNAAGGASTISMQVVRILTPRPDVRVTPATKLKEIWSALQLESRHTKREILEVYINRVPFGRNIEGFAAASRLYYGRSLSELSPMEFCVLAVIPRAPALYDPWRSVQTNLEAALRLGERVMGEGGGGEEAHQRLGSHPFPWPYEAPHFCREILNEIENWSPEQRMGKTPLLTTLDLDIQHRAETILRNGVESARSFRIHNGALILADPRSAEVLAYIGSSDFHDDQHSGQIDGVQMLREPGSTLKPLLYAKALEEGWTASTILPDIPTDFGGMDVYTPGNYNEEFHGPVRLRQALAASLNIPAVYTLKKLGVDKIVDFFLELGFEGLAEQREGLGESLAVGGGQVSLWELLQGYLFLYNGGRSRNLRMMEADGDERQVFSAQTADLINNIISDPEDRVMTFGRRGPLRFDYPAAVKTGTSNQFANVWAVGFTADLAGAVWMGNFSGSTVKGVSGSSLPLGILRSLFDAYSSGDPLPSYSEFEELRICRVSGLSATPHCPYGMTEIYTPGTTLASCDWHADEWGRARAEVLYPQEFAYWNQMYNYGLNFTPEAALDILQPIEDALYHLDPGAPPDSEHIRLQLVGSGEAVLREGEELLFSGSLPADVFWSPRVGNIVFTLSGENAVILRRIWVR